MSELFDMIGQYARFPIALGRLPKEKLTLERARAIVSERLSCHSHNFLTVAERLIYNYPKSPYLPLLRAAGCEFADLQALVKADGVENALRVLRRSGVYFTFEEFKGRAPVVRGSLNFSVTPADFDNPHIKGEFTSQSGGSSGTPTQVKFDMERLVARAPQNMLALEAYGILNGPYIVWRGILPDAGTFEAILRNNLIGRSTDRWFSNIGLRESKHWVKYGLATYYMILAARLRGFQVPFPEYVSTQNAEIIARCAAALRDQHGSCALSAQVSRALRVALAAEQEGLDLHGVTITAGGEPATPNKVQAIRRAGARIFSNYSMREAGTLGFSCAASDDPGDLHFFSDTNILISHPHHVEGFDFTVPAFNLTSLLLSAPKVLLNFQADDYGDVQQRECGCALGAYGFTTHLTNVRSYRKLTGEAVTLVGTDLVQILENVLPTRFGGSPLDYQFQEAEDEQGFTRLYLVIHPRLEIQNEQAVIDVLLQSLSASGPAADAARTVWQQTGTIRIKRAEPKWTARGKLLPLHIERKSQTTI